MTLLGTLTFIAVYCITGGVIVAAFSAHYGYTPKERRFFLQGMVFRGGLTFGYYFYTFFTSSDARSYFRFATGRPFSPESLLKPGTMFVRHATKLILPFAEPFEDPYLMSYIPFSLLAFIGSLYLYRALSIYCVGKRDLHITALAFFLPNLVFWSSNIGKDSIVFFGLSLVLYAISDGKSHIRFVHAGLGLLAVYFVRPHMIIFLAVSLVLFFVGRNAPKTKKANVIFPVVSAILFLLFSETLLGYVGLGLPEENESGLALGTYFESGMTYIESRAEGLNYGGAATGMPTGSKALAPLYGIQFICAPFLWQARKAIHLAGALESIIYQMMLLYLVANWRCFRMVSRIRYKYSILAYVVITSVIFGMAYPNFGLTIRQRCMVLPFIILFYVAVRHEKLQEKTQQKNRRKAAHGSYSMGLRRTPAQTASSG